MLSCNGKTFFWRDLQLLQLSLVHHYSNTAATAARTNNNFPLTTHYTDWGNRWRISSHNNKTSVCASEFKALLSCQDVSTLSGSAAEFELPWPLWNKLFSQGQVDTGAQPKQACYQKINSTASSVDLHVKLPNMEALVCILFACVWTVALCQHGATSTSVNWAPA